MASAQRTPKTVFSGTAIAAISTLSQRACSASGVVTEAQAWPTPFSSARQKTSATGNASSAARYPSAAIRRAYLPIVPRRPAADAADREQHDERDAEQDDRDGRGSGDVV